MILHKITVVAIE